MYGSYKKPGGSKSLRAFFKMSKRFHAYAETFFKKAEAFLKKFEGFSGVGQHQSHSAHCLDFDLRIIFKQLAKFVDKYVQAA